MKTVKVNRAPVLTLWGAVVAERLGHGPATALTLGKAVAGRNAMSKGKRLGIYHEASEEAAKKREGAREAAGVRWIDFMGRKLPVVKKGKAMRAVRDDEPEDPEAIERYLQAKLGDALPAVRAAMQALAKSLPPAELASRAYALYEAFRPKIPAGEKGWGAKGTLDLERLRGLGKR